MAEAVLDDGKYVVDYDSSSGCLRRSRSRTPVGSFVLWGDWATLVDVTIYWTGKFLVTYPTETGYRGSFGCGGNNSTLFDVRIYETGKFLVTYQATFH